jgi:hypothetical protein
MPDEKEPTTDAEFDLKFDSIIRPQAALREMYTEVEFSDKVALKARLELLMLEILPEEMHVNEMMVAAKAAFDAVMKRWIGWIERGSK